MLHMAMERVYINKRKWRILIALHTFNAVSWMKGKNEEIMHANWKRKQNFFLEFMTEIKKRSPKGSFFSG